MQSNAIGLRGLNFGNLCSILIHYADLVAALRTAFVGPKWEARRRPRCCEFGSSASRASAWTSLSPTRAAWTRSRPCLQTPLAPNLSELGFQCTDGTAPEYFSTISKNWQIGPIIFVSVCTFPWTGFKGSMVDYFND